MRVFKAVALALLAQGVLFGCSCRSLNVCDLISRPILFFGEAIDGGVTSITEDPWLASHIKTVRFRVIEAFRGISPGTETVDVALTLWPEMCSPIPYYRGRRYIVSPQGSGDALSDGVCFTGRDLDRNADDARIIREHFSKPALRIMGRVGVADPRALVEYMISSGLAQALEGVRVVARRGNEVVMTNSGAGGKYSLALPGGRPFGITASFPGYPAPPAAEIQSSGCVVHDIGMSTDNTITGRVVDASGDPVADVPVQVRGVKPIGEFGLSTSTGTSGHFEFGFDGALPNGKFVLAANLDGPVAKQPFETAFHPRGSSQAMARVLSVTGGRMHLTGVDIVLGPRVPMRSLRVTAIFPDGKPMRHIEATAAFPDRPGWKYRKVARMDGVASLEVPSTLPVRVTLSDWYGRDLGARYEAQFPAGTTPIEHQFLVRP